MTPDGTQEQFDIACLRHIATDPEAQRVSLAAAMIKLHALAIARSEPTARLEAFEIIEHLGQLYAGLPDRRALSRVLSNHPASARLGPNARDDLVDAIWQLFRCGAGAKREARS